ncbi:MAG: cell wall hydrolase [Rhizomicrobium sp.]
MVTSSLGLSSTDADTLARTIWGEARGEGYDGQVAVGSVVRNRVNAGTYGSGYAAVCKSPDQFSCWNSNDPNYAPMLAITTADATFAQCLTIANGIIDGSIADNTNGATNYYAASIDEPDWAYSMIETGQIGNQIFFRSA